MEPKKDLGMVMHCKKKINRFMPLISGIVFLILISSACSQISSKRLVLNLTDSMPNGVYYVSARNGYGYGDIVCFQVPLSVEHLVLGRGWLKKGHYMMKHVSALPGDEVCINSTSFYIRGSVEGVIQNMDSKGRPLPKTDFCDRLGNDMIFVCNTCDDKSFDSRYFGPIHSGKIIGIATPLWIF